METTMNTTRCAPILASIALVLITASNANCHPTVGNTILQWPTGQTSFDFLGTKKSNFKDISKPEFDKNTNIVTHTYNAKTKGIRMGNIANKNGVKSVWLHMEFDSLGPDIVDLYYDPNLKFIPGQDFQDNTSYWPFILSTGNVAVTGAAIQWDGSSLHIFQTWTINPQPASETIDISNVLQRNGGTDWSANLQTIHVMTACTIFPPAVPEPTSLLLIVSCIPWLLQGRKQYKEGVAPGSELYFIARQ